MREIFALDVPVLAWGKEEGIAETEIEERLQRAADEKMAGKAAAVGLENIQRAEKAVLLEVFWIRRGRIICWRLISCGKASICAVTANAIHLMNTAARRSIFSRLC